MEEHAVPDVCQLKHLHYSKHIMQDIEQVGSHLHPEEFLRRRAWQYPWVEYKNRAIQGTLVHCVPISQGRQQLDDDRGASRQKEAKRVHYVLNHPSNILGFLQGNGKRRKRQWKTLKWVNMAGRFVLWFLTERPSVTHLTSQVAQCDRKMC